MPLPHGYGVLIGTLDHYVRDPINNYGQYYHENVFVNAPNGTYHCAVDVDTKGANDGIEWRVVPMSAADLKGLDQLPNGWHLLEPISTSGAIDNIRTEAFQRKFWIGGWINLVLIYRLKIRIPELFHLPPWTAGTSIEALSHFEPLLVTGRRVFVFGEPFTYGGLGVHNIHQNQGDPPGSQWWSENGIWQDGCTIIQVSLKNYVAFLTKFRTQSYSTDTSGHPA